MNNETHNAERAAWDRGYREALLDIFCYLTGNEQVLDADPVHLALIYGMVTQVNTVGGRLEEIPA